MRDELKWLESDGWEPVCEPCAVSRCRLSLVAGGSNEGVDSDENPCRELRGLLDRIDFEDYVLNEAVRIHIRTILNRLSDDEFEEFCEVYERSRANDD